MIGVFKQRGFISRCCSGLLPFSALAVLATAVPSVPHQVDSYHVVHIYPHDPSAFTQGLISIDGCLYESTGLNGGSSVRMVDLSTGKVLRKYDLPREYFGEGLTDWGDTLVQLTWKAHKGFVYDRASFKLLRTFAYEGEGWGLTHDKNELIMTDGTAYLRFVDPKTFKETHRIRVLDELNYPVENLNELEYVHGEVYANIWRSDEIVRISPHTGKVLGWIDLSGLIDNRELPSADAVLNGIAYDAIRGPLFITGKLWPKLFEIDIIRAQRRPK
jgi:glutamine cyclotransferase